MQLSNENQLILNSIYPGTMSDPVDLSQVNFFREEGLMTLGECFRMGGRKLSSIYHSTISRKMAESMYPEQI